MRTLVYVRTPSEPDAPHSVCVIPRLRGKAPAAEEEEEKQEKEEKDSPVNSPVCSRHPVHLSRTSGRTRTAERNRNPVKLTWLLFGENVFCLRNLTPWINRTRS